MAGVGSATGNGMRGRTADTWLRIVLRLMGTSSLTALVFVAAPHAWMTSIHAQLGLGAMPDTPVVWYLARSTSAFYALLGGLFWLVSFDLKRHRAVLAYLGGALALFGVALFAVDLLEGLPAYWTWWEGPFVLTFGCTLAWLNRRGRGDRAGS